jgi:hypothetical protein
MVLLQRLRNSPAVIKKNYVFYTTPKQKIARITRQNHESSDGCYQKAARQITWGDF